MPILDPCFCQHCFHARLNKHHSGISAGPHRHHKHLLTECLMPVMDILIFTRASQGLGSYTTAMDGWKHKLLEQWKERQMDQCNFYGCYCTLLKQPNDIMNHVRNVQNWIMTPGLWFNITMTFYKYRKSHCGDKMVIRLSYLHNSISYTGKMTSLYWINSQFSMSAWWFYFLAMDFFAIWIKISNC